MKGKIDNNGWLWIERGGKEKLQECPFTQKTFQVNNLTIREPCGDWCPLFGEPTIICLDTINRGDRKTETALPICHGKYLHFDEFTDEKEDV